MRVLVTNDDGIGSPGLHALARAVVEAGWTPVVAGPTTDWSGCSAAMGPLDDHNRVDITAIDLPGLSGVSSHAVCAPPAFIVALATLGVFGEPVDLVLAGVNSGPNTGSSTLYSATVGAVLAGGQRGLSGLALSQVDGRQAKTPQLWHSATDIAMPIIRWLAGRTEPVSLNVNVPNLPLDEIRGIRQTGLASQSSVQTEITERDDHGVGFCLVTGDDEPSQNSDTALLRSGHATVSAITGVAIMEGLTLPLDEWV